MAKFIIEPQHIEAEYYLDKDGNARFSVYINQDGIFFMNKLMPGEMIDATVHIVRTEKKVIASTSNDDKDILE